MLAGNASNHGSLKPRCHDALLHAETPRRETYSYLTSCPQRPRVTRVINSLPGFYFGSSHTVGECQFLQLFLIFSEYSDSPSKWLPQNVS